MAKYDLFDPRFVYGTWDENLFQKRYLFVADDIEGLEDIVNNNTRPENEFFVLRNGELDNSDEYPFRAFDYDDSLSDKGIIYKLCYYDPLYEIKLGYQEGMSVLSRKKDVRDALWLLDLNPTWMPTDYDYKLDYDRTPSCNQGNQCISLFDEECIYRTWDPDLEGKLCWFADNLYSLKRAFYTSSPEILSSSGSFDFPFILARKREGHESQIWRYAYYDPYLELKQARKKGLPIEYCDEGEWHEISVDDELIFSPELYRVKVLPKPFDLVTHRELARWINLGNGELTFSDKSVIGPDCIVSPFFQYEVGETDNPVSDDIRVRKWDSTEWTSPTREYLGLC